MMRCSVRKVKVGCIVEPGQLQKALAQDCRLRPLPPMLWSRLKKWASFPIEYGVAAAAVGQAPLSLRCGVQPFQEAPESVDRPRTDPGRRRRPLSRPKTVAAKESRA